MKITAKAPANIAFIKYWGKVNEKLRLPANSSISMNLSDAFTITTVEKDPQLKSDKVSIDGEVLKGEALARISKHIDILRNVAKDRSFLRVKSQNNFPKGAGIASSASGFAALTFAASKAYGLSLGEKELSILARLGSGSAARSIPDGFVEWKKGTNSNNSYAVSLYSPDYWDLVDLIAVVGTGTKKVGSTEGHGVAETSPFYKSRIKGMPSKITELKNALKMKDFTKFGEIIEAEAISMHTVMMTSNPPLYYWNPETLRVVAKVIELREKGIESYFTIDAGPNVHIICEASTITRLKPEIVKIKGVKRILINKVSKGAELVL